MFGKTSKDLPYYVCYRDEVHHRGADWFDAHPKALWVSEKILLGAVHWFFGERVFGPRRSEYLNAQLAATHPEKQAGDSEKVKQLRDEIKAIDKRKERLLDELDANDGSGDPELDGEFRRSIRERFDRHERKRRDLLGQLHHHEQREAADGSIQDATLIDLLPRLGASIAKLPEAEQRRPYDAFQLEVHYLWPRREIDIQVTIPAATAEELSRMATDVTAPLTVIGTGVDQP